MLFRSDQWYTETGFNIKIFNASFLNCINLTTVPTTLPPGVTFMDLMFSGATSFNGNISNWDISNVTSMNQMFNNTSSFSPNTYPIPTQLDSAFNNWSKLGRFCA